MSSEAPKLFTNKPKKGQLKQFQEQHKGNETAFSMAQPSQSSSATAAATSYKMGPPPPPPPPPPKESFARRYRFLWPLLLVVNLAVGGYVLIRTTKKDTSTTEEQEGASDTPSPTTAAATITTPVTNTTAPTPIVQRDPIPADQQRELYKWMLEEKRKVKPKDSEEKKRIDEEKALLKQFIRAKSIPSF